MIRNILQYPDPILNQLSKDVVDFDESLIELFKDMKDTLVQAKGVGISGIQIGVPFKVCTIRTGQDNFVDMCNPVIVQQFGDVYIREGCLSLVGLYVAKHAPEDVTVEFQDLKGIKQTISMDGIFARCILHEIEHHLGDLIVDHIPAYKKFDVLKKWKRKIK